MNSKYQLLPNPNPNPNLSLPRKKSSKSSNKKFSPLTPEEKQHQRDNQLCLYCGEKDCPGAKDVKTCSKRPKKAQVNSIQAVTHDLPFVDLEISLPEGSKMVKALVDSGCSYPLFFSQHIIDMYVENSGHSSSHSYRSFFSNST
jgi:hypothetical protein